MNRRNIITLISSAIAGAGTALIICLVLFFFFYKPAQIARKPFEDEIPTPLRKEPESPQISTTKAKLSEINSLALSTVYTGFYSPNSECGKSSDPAPKPDNSISLSYSPCRTVLTFNRSGEAVKSLSIKRPDKNTNAPDLEEKSEWKSKITAEQFETLLKTVAGNPDVLEWANVLINHGNCALWAYYNNNGVMQLPLFVDIRRGTALPASLKGFKDLDTKVVWKKN